jgi:hypothetical protein
VIRAGTAVLVLLLAGALAACGSGDPGPSASESSPRTSATTAPTPTSPPSSTPPDTASNTPSDTPASEPAGTPDGTPPPPAASTPPPGGAVERWQPEQGTSWQYQLSGRLDLSVDAAVYDVDWEETTAAQVAQLHAAGRHVICYVNAGAFEDWRPDAGAYPEELLGKPLDGWPGERWLDIRRTDLLLPLLAARLDFCRAKGFDAVEADNVDGWANDTGFPLTAQDQLTFNTAVARLAHDRGMSVGLKNDVEQVTELEPVFDFAVNEECLAYDECGEYTSFLAKGKAVLHVEYENSASRRCVAASVNGMSTIFKFPDLGSDLRDC